MKDTERLHQALEGLAAQRVPETSDLWPRMAARLNERKSILQTLRARPALLALLILLALSLLTGVVFALGRLTGYIPGVGLIDQSAPLRVLSAPVTLTRSGVTLTVKSALLSADKTVLFVQIDGVPSEAYPQGELGGCPGKVDLRLLDGSLLEGGHISGGNWNSFETRLAYGPVPQDVNDATLLVGCIGGTTPGALPENWQVPLSFAPAPPDLTVAPVVELATPVVASTRVPGLTSTPTLSNTATLHGITFTLEKFVEIADGYQLYGSLDLKDLKLPAQAYPNSTDRLSLTLTDATGARVPFEEANFEPQDNSNYDPNKITWIYRTHQKAFNAPLILSLESFSVTLNPSVSFELDLGPKPQIGQIWQIERDLNFNGHGIRLLSAKLLKSDSPEWASVLQFTYQDTEGGIFINVVDDVPQKPLVDLMGGGGSGGPPSGTKQAGMAYSSIPNGLRHFKISASVPDSLNGPWQVLWNPPASSEPVPTAEPEACLNSRKWAQLKQQPAALPTGLGGRVLYSTEAMWPDINIFSANLDGSDQHGFYSGYYPALSPDRTRMVFMTDAGELKVLDLNSMQTSRSFGSGENALWSPDGQRILFSGLYVINADGSGLRKIETGSVRVQPVGWLPDNQTIVFGAQNGDIHALYQHTFKTYNLQSGETKSLFQVNIKTAMGSISADGQWIAFNEKVFGTNPDGAVFVARLDGSERRMVASLDDAYPFHPLWGPVGPTGEQWLIVNIFNPNKAPSPVLVNPFTCQAVLISGLQGEIQSWAP